MKNQNNRQQAHENETIWVILIMGIVCIIFFLIGVFASGYWLVEKFSKPSATVEAKHPDSLVIIDRGDNSGIRFYHAKDTINYIIERSKLTKATLK